MQSASCTQTSTEKLISGHNEADCSRMFPEFTVSTSAGSWPSPPSTPKSAYASSIVAGLPDYVYPQLKIQNTFLSAARCDSDDVLPERRANSCPTSEFGLANSCPTSDIEPPGLDRWPSTMSAEGLEALLGSHVSTVGGPADAQRWPSTMSDDALSAFLGEVESEERYSAPLLSTPAPTLFGGMHNMLNLSAARALAIGTGDLPSVGSAGHHIGDCKPCAFLYSRGCENAKSCEYCHLCTPGEKKRRAKGKKKEAKRMAEAEEAEAEADEDCWI